MTRRIAAPSARSGEGGTALSKRHSLSVQLFCDVLRSLLAAAAAFALCFALGTIVLNHTVYGDAFLERLTDRKFAALVEYVAEQQVTSENLRPLDIWSRQSGHVYLVLYDDNGLLYDSYAGTETDADEYSPAQEDPDCEYALTLSDGTPVRAFLYCYAGSAYYYWVLVLSGLAGFLVFSLCFVAFVHRKMRYIRLLKRELDILAGGDLEYQVTVRGSDELSDLAKGIDQMRCSILAHRAAEERLRSANSELVTAMSHDLRTPLTSLLAYLELMDREKYEDQQQLKHFIRRSLDKTLQIKTMADKLFEYILVYSSEWEQPELEPADADSLFGQLWGEYAFSLESRGFTVECCMEPLDGIVRISPDLLRRAFDNLYANLLKYADPAGPIGIACRREQGSVQLTLSNRISPGRDRRESTNIGLHTCERILRCHGGSFVCRENSGTFTATLCLPLTAR